MGLGRSKRLSAALAQGYEGYVSLELFSEALWQQDPTEVARLGMEKMQAYFAA